jgi:hypothetical protein
MGHSAIFIGQSLEENDWLHKCPHSLWLEVEIIMSNETQGVLFTFLKK